MKLLNPEIRLEPTNFCNSHCVMCPRELMTRKKGFMEMDLYHKIIDEAVTLGAKVCSLENFGEPFLDPSLIEKAEYAKSKGLKTYTISNGSLLGKRMAEKAVKAFDKIRISFYGTSKDTYEYVMRGLNYDKAYENLENLLENHGDCRIEIYFLALGINEHETEFFIRRYAHRAKVSVWKPHNWIYGRDYRELGETKKSCGRPFSGPLQVHWNGKVVPCCWDFNSEMILGDLNTQTISEVLEGESYLKIRNAHVTGKFKDYLCDKCDQLYRDESVMVYTNIEEAKVGKTNTGYDRLD